ncbi:interleukin-1 receptor accessory protein isoform X2 [Hoplias malabaricus]|uniref:interleukin-1 receptor accessory protein isoform X2 n=1 Tax=Hoplias malabaricus TaxID=27720 RepID=UPI003462BDD5
MMLMSAVLFTAVVTAGSSTPAEALPTLESGVQCVDWGILAGVVVGVYEGESRRIACPLFSFPLLYNYTSSSGHTLLWYRHTHTHELEQPIVLGTHTFLKNRDSLWIQPATRQDSGTYICMIRNSSSCVKMGVEVAVIDRDGVCDRTLHHNVSIPIQSSYTLRCPDLQQLHTHTRTVTWLHNCDGDVLVFPDREVKGDEVVIYKMLTSFAGSYTCNVSYESNGHKLHFTHTINVRAVSPSSGSKEPRIHNPTSGHVYTVTVGEDAKLTCRAFLPYLPDEDWMVWWSIDNKTVEELAEPRCSSPAASVELDDYGDLTVLRVLHIAEFSTSDLQREFRCSAKNSRGNSSSIATLKEEVYIPSVELGCGLGATLALAILLFVLYRVYKLELHLIYRSWFGTDERSTDDKEFDVYISYARNGEEEQFVMTTLRRVLEVELGYSVCIFDRDSLPGGTITDETLRFVGRSRRLVVVVSALSAVRGTQALLELQAGLSLLRGGSLKVVLIQYKHINKQLWVKELRRARVALTLLRWKGDESMPLSSRFWKQLQLELPVRTHSTHTAKYNSKPSLDTHTPGNTHSAESTALVTDTLHTPQTHTAPLT